MGSKMENPNDLIREKILRHLYEVHQNARSLKSAGTNMRDLKSAMKQKGVAQQEVVANLDYLIQKGWVGEVVEEKMYTTGTGVTVPSTSRRYKITDVGVDKVEGESVFQRRDRYAGIKVTNIKGVTVVGNENVVNVEYSDLYSALDGLENAASMSDNLSDEDKLNVIADVESLKNQLSKPEPDKTIVSKLWSGIEKTAKVAGLVQSLAQIAPLMQQFMG